MSDLIGSAVEVLLPLAAAGAGAAVTEAGRRTGAGLQEQAAHILRKVLGREFRTSNREELTQALEDALAQQRVTVEELHALVTFCSTSGPQVGTVRAKNSFVGETNIDTFNA
jgi:hypothetical protein